MRIAFETFRRLSRPRRNRRKGQTLVEYALVLAVLTVIFILVFKLLDARLVVLFSTITNLLDTAQSSH